MEYTRGEKENSEEVVYVYEKNSEELTKCRVVNGLPVFPGELEGEFLSRLITSRALAGSDRLSVGGGI